jgi:hypothetical protein
MTAFDILFFVGCLMLLVAVYDLGIKAGEKRAKQPPTSDKN